MCENVCSRVVFVYVYAHRYQKKVFYILELDDRQVWATRHGCWLNFDLMEEQHLFLTTQLSPQPPENFYACKNTVLH